MYVATFSALNKSSDRFLAKEVPLYCPSNTAVMASRSVDFPASLSPTTILIPGENSTCSLENLLIQIRAFPLYASHIPQTV